MGERKIIGKLRVATAFSGIGSPEMALRLLGYDHEVVFACEIDKFARKSYKANYEIDDDHFHKDIKELDGRCYGSIDLFVAGPPCQDYSIAGKRVGLIGNRGHLFYDFSRLVTEIRPKYFIIENVKGMLSSNDGKDFEKIMEVLRHECGYHCTFSVLNTKDFGIPQNRERVFVVGFRDDLHHEYIGYEYPKPFKLEKRLRDVLEDDADEKYYLSDKTIKGFLRHKDRHEEKGTGFKWEPKTKNDVAVCLRANGALAPTDNTIIEPKILQKSRGFNNGGEHKISPTITINSWQENNHLDYGYKIRKLTPRECFRLQGLPDSFKFVCSDSQLYKQAGNSITVDVMMHLIKSIIEPKKESLF